MLSVAYYNKSDGITTKTEYAGNKVYKNGTLSMVLTEEGYATVSGTPVYYYYLKDHQGNNRVVINQGGTVQQVNHYYAFGGLFGEGMQTSNQPYKYNGKEIDRVNGLDMYDYGARHYDAAIGRFITQDRFSEKYYNLSNYQYAANNPINIIDINGDSIWYTINENIVTMHVTAKIINRSSYKVNMSRAAKSISTGMDKAFSGKFKIDGVTYKLETDIQLEVASTMGDVLESDHLFVLSDKWDYGKAPGKGATNMEGGKVMSIWAGDYDNFFFNNTRSALHEFGHAAGLPHTESSTNLMRQKGLFNRITPEQRLDLWNARKYINREPNSFGNRPYPYYHYRKNAFSREEVITDLKTIGLFHKN